MTILIKEKPKQKKEFNKTKNKKNDDFFIPSEKDTLFWCYYIIINGIQSYEMLFHNTFKEEKQQKLNFIEKIRNFKDILKKYKFKRTEIENDIGYSQEISIKTFLAMCAIENKNICILKNRCLLYINCKRHI